MLGCDQVPVSASCTNMGGSIGTPLTIGGASWNQSNGGTATLTFAAQPTAPAAGTTITVANLNSANGTQYDGNFTVLANPAATTTTLSYSESADPGAAIINGGTAPPTNTPSPTCNGTPCITGLVGDRSAMPGLPNGPISGATASANIGTISGDSAVTEVEGEEGAVLEKNNNTRFHSPRAISPAQASRSPDRAPSTRSPLPPVRRVRVWPARQ